LKKSSICILALLVIAPIVTFALWSALIEVADFFNPCLTWGVGSSGSVTLNPGLARLCSNSAGEVSQTIADAVTGLILIQGGILSAAILGAFGVIRAHPRLASLAAVILFIESVPLMLDGLFVFTILGGCFFLWASRGNRINAGSLGTSIDSSRKV
jgi:hypothetical protein